MKNSEYGSEDEPPIDDRIEEEVMVPHQSETNNSKCNRA